MQPAVDLLVSTLLSFPDEQRAELERRLAPLARNAALGELTADVAHDVANPLFGAIGLVDLLAADAAPGSQADEYLQMLRRTTAEMKATLQGLLDFARLADDDAGRSSLQDAARDAARLLRHGSRRAVAVEERFPAEPVHVPCPRGALVQAVLHLLLAAPAGNGIVLEVDASSLSVSPPPEETLGTLVAARVVGDHGGTVERSDRSLTLRWTG
jgi:signal transduction histidine kinase